MISLSKGISLLKAWRKKKILQERAAYAHMLLEHPDNLIDTIRVLRPIVSPFLRFINASVIP
tara:strand:- start:60 stop:245 length:186 start_codon:yes stop_codon:yes gene_type:complete